MYFIKDFTKNNYKKFLSFNLIESIFFNLKKTFEKTDIINNFFQNNPTHQALCAKLGYRRPP